MKNLSFLYTVIFLLLSSCEELFQYHPNQIILDDDETRLTAFNLSRIGTQMPEDTVHLLVMGDTQRFYDAAQDFVEVANQFNKIDFVIHLGDISDFGMTQEFRWVHDIMRKLKWPYLTVVGNHDLVANGRNVYQEMYGDFNYSFIYGEIKFIFIDTNGREYNFNGSTPNLKWLQSELIQLDDEAWDQGIIISHVPPFDDDFDNDLELDFHNTLAESGVVNLSLHGHRHSWTTEKKYDNDVTYHVTTTVKERGYSYVKIWKGGYNIERKSY